MITKGFDAVRCSEELRIANFRTHKQCLERITIKDVPDGASFFLIGPVINDLDQLFDAGISVGLA